MHAPEGHNVGSKRKGLFHMDGQDIQDKSFWAIGTMMHAPEGHNVGR